MNLTRKRYQSNMLRRHFLKTVLLLVLGRIWTLGQISGVISDPATDFVMGYASGDSSTIAELSSRVVGKVVCDFNSDGLNDVALTDYFLWGAHIGPWQIYLAQQDGQYKYFDELWFHDPAIRIDSLAKGKSRVYTYDKSGGGEGDIVEYELSLSTGIREISRKSVQPDEPDGEDHKLYESLFGNSRIFNSCLRISDYLTTKKIVWREQCY